MALKMPTAPGILIAGLLLGQQAGPTLAQGVALLQLGDAAGAVNLLKAVPTANARTGVGGVVSESPVNR
jgi:hypothetical protein